MQLQIKDKIKSIFGQYKGIYISDERLSYELHTETSEPNQIFFLNKGDTVTIDLLVPKEFVKDKIIETDSFILNLYAKNPKKGFVVIIL